ncbi:MAG: autotransporter-associated beta strand repeat-containing protein, partial [Chthoniobacteraceae bacterium]
NATISGSNGLTFSGVPGGAFNRLRLAGNNTFTGPLTINRGEVSFTSLQNLGADNSPITLNAGMLSYRGFSNFILSPEIRTAGIGSRIETTTGATLTLGSRISGPGTIEFRGKIALPTANTHEGGTTVAGEVFFDSDAAFGTGGLALYGVQVGNGTILRPQAAWTTARTIFLGGLTETYLDAGFFDVVWNGPISSDVSYSGPFVKRGAGKLTLNANSKFGAALRVDAGALVVNGTLESDFLSGSISGSVGTTISGSGFIQRNVTVSGTLDPGDGVGALSTKNVTFADGSTFALTLDSRTSFDRLNVAGTVSLNGQINLVLWLGYDPADGVDSFTLLDNDGTDAIGGTGLARFAFAGTPLEEGAIFAVGTQGFQISYAGGTGNDVTIRAVPEPNTSLLLLTAFTLLLRRNAHSRRADRR